MANLTVSPDVDTFMQSAGQAEMADAVVDGQDIAPASVTTTLNVAVGGSLFFGPSAQNTIWSQAPGVVTFWNSNGTDFDRIQLGGTTSSFPALGRSGASLTAGLADGTGHALIVTSSSSVKIISGGSLIDVGSISVGTTTSVTATVTGAVSGDTVVVGHTDALPTGVSVTGRVSAADTVTLDFVNASLIPQDPDAMTYYLSVIHTL